MLPYGKQSISHEDVQAVAEVLQSDYLTTGPSVAAFEERLCQLTGARFAVACANGTAALHLACLALKLSPADTGLTAPLTFLASANCFEFCSARTGFADIDPETLCLSPRALEQYCLNNPPPRVVVAVDFAGVPADLPQLQRLSSRFGFTLIEDAAHALGSAYEFEGDTVQCGSCRHTDMAIFSFHPVKTITTGEGGAVLTNNPELEKRLRLLRSHGMTKDRSQLSRSDGEWYYEMAELGYNYRLTDLQCALGLSQLDRLESFKARRSAIVASYNRAFGALSSVLLPPQPPNTSPCYHLYVLRFKDGAPTRGRAYEYLKSRGIHPQVHYYPVHLQPYYRERYGFRPGHCPAAENYYEGCLSLPLFPAMSDVDVETVISAVQSFMSER